jgi:HK97 family phage major capsid protein
MRKLLTLLKILNKMDLKEQIQNALEESHKKFDSRIEELSKQWNDAENDRTAQKELVKQINEEWKNHKETTVKVQEQLDALETQLKRGNAQKSKHRLIQIADFLRSDEAFKEMQMGNKKQHSFPELGQIMSTKEDMTQANAFESTAVVAPDYVPGIFYDPDTAFRVRNLMPVGITNSNAVNVVREYDYTDATDITAEGAEYKQGDFNLKMTSATVYKITGYLILSEEMLEDVDGLASYIYSRLPSKLAVKENQQLLYGTGSSEISGLYTNATAYTDNLADSATTLIDVLADAVRQVKDDEYMPTAILLHPADVTSYLTLNKDSTNRYMAPWVFTGESPTIAGVPVIESTAVTQGTFFVGDFQRAAQVFDRRQNTVEISNQNEDNFIKGMLTVRAAERIALAIYRPSAFIYDGSIAGSIAEGSA